MKTFDTKALEALLGPQLTEQQARQIYALGAEAVVHALLFLIRIIVRHNLAFARPDPSTPSGQIPPYAKAGRTKRPRPKGARPGHPGRRRPTPPQVDRRVEHQLEACPKCHGPVSQMGSQRTRVIEDLPANPQPEVTEHTLPRYWCKTCRKRVEPVVAEALPNAQIGLRVVVLSAWLHYLLGTTLSQIVELFRIQLNFRLSAGGLVSMWQRLSEVLWGWYERIQEEALSSAVLHADETGWRVQGRTHWLWCFSNQDSTYYLIDRCRGSPALKKFFTREFAGVLVTDFWAAYNAVMSGKKQKCLPHLLRDLKRTERYQRPGGDWPEFARRLKRLIRDGLRLSRDRRQLKESVFARRRARLQARLGKLLEAGWEEKQARRLVKRLRRHRGELLTFLEEAGVPSDNNHAERMIRPAVIVRKNSYANGSERGAAVQAVLMSVFRTLKQRGHNPVQVVLEAVRNKLKTGQLPPLPGRVMPNG